MKTNFQFKPLTLEFNFALKIHDLRHSHASYLISKGANIKLIADRLGHSKHQ